MNTNEILEKQNKELKDVMFDKNELIISPREYLRRRNLIKMKNRIDMLKQKGYPRSAVIYFMCMKKFWDGGKAGAAIKRGMLKADIGSFFTR